MLLLDLVACCSYKDDDVDYAPRKAGGESGDFHVLLRSVSSFFPCPRMIGKCRESVLSQSSAFERVVGQPSLAFVCIFHFPDFHHCKSAVPLCFHVVEVYN